MDVDYVRDAVRYRYLKMYGSSFVRHLTQQSVPSVDLIDRQASGARWPKGRVVRSDAGRDEGYRKVSPRPATTDA